MPKHVVELSEHANRIVDFVKTRDGLQSRSAAIERILEEYDERILDPVFRPDFVEDVLRVLEGTFKSGSRLDETLG